MKLKHRIVGLTLTAVLVVIVYLMVSEDMLPDLRSNQFNKLTIKKSENGVVGGNVCTFADRLIPQTGIHTQTLFDDIPVDDGQQPLRFVREPSKVSRTKPGLQSPPLRVFLIPHSHNDPGWLKTLNQYYIDQTKSILDSMVEKLTKYKDMTFVWSETVFLSLWWKDIDDETKKQVKNLIERGQLELVTGGWVDPDEATTHYVDIVDEMMEGHRWLEEHLSVRPEVYWAPDPFGYSSTMPLLVKRAGFKRMVILRIHDEVKAQLREKKNLEFFWRQSWDLADRNTDLFTHILPYILYSIKHSCGPDPYVCLMFDFRRVSGEFSEANPPVLSDENVDTYARYLVDQFRAKAQHYKQNVIFMPLGDDFRFDRPIEWDQQYENYKMLFDYINQQKDWNVKATFGTPSEYFRTLENEDKYYRSVDESPAVKPSYPVLYGDFYPYMDRDEEYWTGFYTTRPFWKGLARDLQADLRSAEILNSLANVYAKFKLANFHSLLSNMGALDEIRQSLSLFQHHDAVTGTSKPDVVLDYGDRLWRAKKLSHRVKLSSLAYLLSNGQVQMNVTAGARRGSKAGPFIVDVDDARNGDSPKSSKTLIPISFEGTKVIFFNPVGHSRDQLVRLRVDSAEVVVTDHEGNTIPSQILPIWKNSQTPKENEFELVFYCKVPGFGMRTYTVKKIRDRDINQYKDKGLATVSTMSSSDTDDGSWIKKEKFNPEAEIQMKNRYLTAHFNREWGLLHSVIVDGQETRCDIRFLSYTSSRSGAYLFYPQGKARENMFAREGGVSPVIFVLKGPLTSEIRVVWQFLTHTARLYHTDGPQSRALEFVNYFDVSGESNFFLDKEIIMRLHTSVRNKDQMFTDLNGYQMRRRKMQEKFHIAGNYYPMTAMAFIQDNSTRLSLLSRQSHGASSQKPGQLEVMLERKLSFDDNRGLGEGVFDNLPTTTNFYLLVENGKQRVNDINMNPYPSLLAHELSNQLLYPVNNFYQLVHDAPFLPLFSPLTMNLPCDLHIVNLKAMVSSRDKHVIDVALVLHRLGFQCQYPSKLLSCNVESRLPAFTDIFTDLKVTSVNERSLSLMHAKSSFTPSSSIPIQPMDIATFLLTFNSKA